MKLVQVSRMAGTRESAVSPISTRIGLLGPLVLSWKSMVNAPLVPWGPVGPVGPTRPGAVAVGSTAVLPVTSLPAVLPESPGLGASGLASGDASST